MELTEQTAKELTEALNRFSAAANDLSTELGLFDTFALTASLDSAAEALESFRKA